MRFWKSSGFPVHSSLKLNKFVTIIVSILPRGYWIIHQSINILQLHRFSLKRFSFERKKKRKSVHFRLQRIGKCFCNKLNFPLNLISFFRDMETIFLFFYQDSFKGINQFNHTLKRTLDRDWRKFIFSPFRLFTTFTLTKTEIVVTGTGENRLIIFSLI